MVAIEQNCLWGGRQKKRLPAIRTESLTSKSDSQRRDFRKRVCRRNTQLLSAQALNPLFYFLIIHILSFVFCKDLFTGSLRSIFATRRIIVMCVGRITACLTALFTLLSTTSASEQDILKSTQDRESHQKDQQDKEEEHQKQKFKHIPSLSWFITQTQKYEFWFIFSC